MLSITSSPLLTNEALQKMRKPTKLAFFSTDISISLFIRQVAFYLPLVENS